MKEKDEIGKENPFSKHTLMIISQHNTVQLYTLRCVHKTQEQFVNVLLCECLTVLTVMPLKNGSESNENVHAHTHTHQGPHIQ